MRKGAVTRWILIADEMVSVNDNCGSRKASSDCKHTSRRVRIPRVDREHGVVKKVFDELKD